MKQNKLVENDVTDSFAKSLGLTPEKVKQDMNSMKTIDGFPEGDEEDILELSNPPYYTAYPSPYIVELVRKLGKTYNPESDGYSREPFVSDVSEGRTDQIYNIHSYHTKVPPQAIQKYIEHYTEKGDIIFDGFCGSGMTALAALRVNRVPVVLDLSPICSFVAYNNIKLLKTKLTRDLTDSILSKVKQEVGKYFVTRHIDGRKGNIIYSILSEEYDCISCGFTFSYWDQAEKKAIDPSSKEICCPKCGYKLSISKLKGKRKNGKLQFVTKKIIYEVDGKRFEKEPDGNDKAILKEIETFEIPYWCPLEKFNTGDKLNEFINKGFTTVSDAFTKRNLIGLSAIFAQIQDFDDKEAKKILMYIFTSSIPRLNILNRYMPEHNRHVGPLSGTIYVPRLIAEINPLNYFQDKIDSLFKVDDYIPRDLNYCVSTQSATDLKNIPANSIDYIFTDPPFGDNIMYSELNFVWETWIKVKTNNRSEAIMNKTQKKQLIDYELLMGVSFKEFYRIIKPNRWITVEFHNTQASVWRAIQDAIVKAGFIIGQVIVLDKKKGTVNQLSYAGTVKNDLIINAYKPSDEFRQAFLRKSGQNLEKDFVRLHLAKLPIEPNIERSRQMLYSKLLAQYIQNSFEVRMDASEFYGLLRNNFVERDGFWFNEEQLSEYEKRLKLKKNLGSFNLNQTILGIDGEKTAIIWLSQFLRTPKTYSEILIEYNKNLLTSDDKIPELKLMLEENFITENGKFRLPSLAEKREKEDIREKRLSREFQEMLQEASAGKKIIDVRKEALLHGLIELYKKKAVDQIRVIGKKIDSKLLESDDEIYAIIDWAISKDD